MYILMFLLVLAPFAIGTMTQSSDPPQPPPAQVAQPDAMPDTPAASHADDYPTGAR